MSKSEQSSVHKDKAVVAEKMEYTVTLIEESAATLESPVSIVHQALMVLEFGGISAKDFLNYLDEEGK